MAHVDRLAVFAALAVGLACGGSAPPPPEIEPATRRALADGVVVGFASEDGAHVWRGIPFAAPPVGPLRWRAPRPSEPWAGERPANRFGASCVQFGGQNGGNGSGDPDEPTGSEDCLFANVFAPPFAPGAVPRGDARLPVMVWIHGGGNTLGSADLYDLGRLAVRQNVVAIAVQYRLGAFGWFRHPTLHGENDSPDDRSGNYGTLDLVRALQWVKDNASAFGGDPDRLTIFGESAGGLNVYSLLLSPRARGLFHGAIVQSGGLWTTSIAEASHFSDDAEPGHARSAREVLLTLLERRGADDRDAARSQLDALESAEIEALLRGASAGEILGLYRGDRLGGMYEAPLVIRDGHVIPRRDPMEALEAGAYNRVPAIVGTNRDENKLFLLLGESDAVTRLFGVPLWLSDSRRFELFAEYQSRMWKATGVDEPAEAMSRSQGASVFAYRFDWDEEPKLLWADLGIMLGAAHGIEIPFVLGRLELGAATDLVFDEERLPAAEQLSDAMMSYWGRFAHAGRPGRGHAEALPHWKAWDATSLKGDKFLVLDTNAGGGIRMSSRSLTRAELIAAVERDDRFKSRRERCEVYGNFVRWTESMSRDEYARAADGACRPFPIDGDPR